MMSEKVGLEKAASLMTWARSEFALPELEAEIDLVSTLLAMVVTVARKMDCPVEPLVKDLEAAYEKHERLFPYHEKKN